MQLNELYCSTLAFENVEDCSVDDRLEEESCGRRQYHLHRAYADDARQVDWENHAVLHFRFAIIAEQQ